MKCDRVRQVLHEGPEVLERCLLRLHLLRCPRCRGEATQIHAAEQALARLPRFEPPPALLPKVLAAAEAAPVPKVLAAAEPAPVPKVLAAAEAAPVPKVLATAPVMFGTAKERNRMRRVAYVALAIFAIAVAATLVIPGGGKDREARSLLAGVAHALEQARSLHIVFRGTQGDPEAPGVMRLMPGQGEIWIGDRAVHMDYLGPEGELLHASVLDCQAGFWWVYARDKSALYEADLEPLGGKACEIIDRLAEMIRASHLTDAVRAHFPDAQDSVEMATRDGREVALVTVSYTTDAGGVPVHVREVFEVDPETDHLLSTRKFSRTGDGAEELVGAVDKVEYDVPLPDAAAAAGIPEGTETVQATAGIEETSSTFALVMKVDGVELGRMDVLRAE